MFTFSISRYTIYGLVLFLFFGFVSDAFALGTISTDKNYYLPGGEIFYTLSNPKSEGANIVLYHIETGKLSASCENANSLMPTRKVSESCFLPPDFSKLAGLPPVGKYSLVVDTFGICETGLNYTKCKNQSGFSSEAKFRIGMLEKNKARPTLSPKLTDNKSLSSQKQINGAAPTVQTEIDKNMSAPAPSLANQVPVAGRRLNFLKKLIIWLISPLGQINWRR